MSMCEDLHTSARSLRRFRFPLDLASVPRDGIYILFEEGETAHGGDRIVRVGTHTGQHQLRSRLKQHFLIPNKDRSIFRRNIGRALLSRDGDPFAGEWELDRTSREKRDAWVDMQKQRAVEQRVSECIQTVFSFSVVRMDAKEDRLRIESRMISTVSSCRGCGPSEQWLGRWTPKEKIRRSGLWLVNELYKTPLSVSDLLPAPGGRGKRAYSRFPRAPRLLPPRRGFTVCL